MDKPGHSHGLMQVIALNHVKLSAFLRPLRPRFRLLATSPTEPFIHPCSTPMEPCLRYSHNNHYYLKPNPPYHTLVFIFWPFTMAVTNPALLNGAAPTDALSLSHFVSSVNLPNQQPTTLQSPHHMHETNSTTTQQLLTTACNGFPLPATLHNFNQPLPNHHTSTLQLQLVPSTSLNAMQPWSCHDLALNL